VCGTVQLVLDQPENQPHRAELSKMLVHRRALRQGLGAALMRAAEATARACGKTLLVLDTADDEAERLYERLGYALLPQGGLCGTTVDNPNLGGSFAAIRVPTRLSRFCGRIGLNLP
jgi:GNAT superfamily N-acetyltransferase